MPYGIVCCDYGGGGGGGWVGGLGYATVYNFLFSQISSVNATTRVKNCEHLRVAISLLNRLCLSEKKKIRVENEETTGSSCIDR